MQHQPCFKFACFRITVVESMKLQTDCVRQVLLQLCGKGVGDRLLTYFFTGLQCESACLPTGSFSFGTEPCSRKGGRKRHYPFPHELPCVLCLKALFVLCGAPCKYKYYIYVCTQVE